MDIKWGVRGSPPYSISVHTSFPDNHTHPLSSHEMCLRPPLLDIGLSVEDLSPAPLPGEPQLQHQQSALFRPRAMANRCEVCRVRRLMEVLAPRARTPDHHRRRPRRLHGSVPAGKAPLSDSGASGEDLCRPGLWDRIHSLPCGADSSSSQSSGNRSSSPECSSCSSLSSRDGLLEHHGGPRRHQSLPLVG